MGKKLFHFMLAIVMVITLIPVSLVTAESDAGPELVNLALGKSYTLETAYPDYWFGRIENSHADDTGGQLTNGVYGGTTFSNKEFVGRLRQGNRVVTIDLAKPSTIQSITLNALQDLPVGINFPEEVKVSVSNNKTAWEDLGTIYNAMSTTAKGSITQKLTLKSINKVARYVRLEISVETWLFIDEIEVWGTADSSGERLQPSANGPNQEKGYPIKGSKQVGDIKNEVLIYTGEWKYQPSDWISFKKEDYKPYISYVDQDMNRKDFMFDTFLFLPYAPQLDGATFSPTGAKPTNKTHWEKYLDRLFRVDYEFGALNEAVKEAKAELPDRGYEAKVVVAIPFPRVDQSDFGDVDGDGVSENTNIAEVGEETAFKNRQKIVKWFVDEVYSRWEEEGYDQLNLVGFYWYNEYVANQVSELDHELIKWTAEYVHSKQAKFQWIPYYFARGWNDWKELGFDFASMQPNYMFHYWAKPERVDTVAQAAYDNGMGVEIEMSDSVLTSEFYRNRYYKYLDSGRDNQYMIQSYQVFYQQVKTLLKAAHSTDPAVREVYDKTYEYLKGIYQGQ